MTYIQLSRDHFYRHQDAMLQICEVKIIHLHDPGSGPWPAKVIIDAKLFNVQKRAAAAAAAGSINNFINFQNRISN